jgi:quercetin dioxygenase-like cupin family protein
MNRTDYFQIGDQIGFEEPAKGIKRQIFGYNDQIMMVKVSFETGAIGDIHSHHHAQVSYVEAGEFEMTIGGEVKLLRKGDGFFVPPNVLHGSKCIAAGVLIDVFNPMREDFL